MNKSKVFLLIGIIMVAVMIVFIAIALTHPEQSFQGGNAVAYPVYVIYVIIIVVMFVLVKKKK